MKQRYKLLLSSYILLSCLSVNAQSAVEFIENRGQWGDWFQYKAETNGGNVLLERDGFRFILADAGNKNRLDSFHHGQIKENPKLNFHCYKVTFEGANNPAIVGEKPQQTYYNYYLGNDPSRWKTEIHPNFAVNYFNLYHNIDMHIASESGSVVYEFMVKPGANTDKVRLKFKGQNSIHVENGDLIVHTSVGDVKEMKPYAYQYINDEKVEVSCKYQLEDDVLSFVFPKGFDHTQLLVIDPTIVFSTLTGSTADNWGFTATYDNSGNFYSGGLVNDITFGGSFPVSTGAFQMSYGGGYGDGSATYGFAYGCDISLMKYNATGSTRLFGTYIGGAGNDHVHSMIVDGNGDLLMAGRTISRNYPITSGAYQTSNRGGWDMIVSKMSPTGTTMVASTYIGGTGDDCVNYDSTEYGYGELKFNYGDESRSEIQVDNSGNVYVTGCTFSNNFPVTSTATSASISGPQDGVVFKMNNNLTSLIWSTYLGGSAYDAGYVLAFDNAQQYLYVAGGTNSSDFRTISGAWRASYGGGGADGFVCKFLNSGAYTLQRSSFVGTGGYDQVYGVQVDPSDNVYVMGQSLGGSFPVTTGVFSNPNSCQFIMKMDANLTSDLISTVFGSGTSTQTNISPVAFLVDTCENVYVSGWGGNLGISGVASGSCSGMTVTSDASQATTDGGDFYFIVFAPSMTAVRYATYFGRNCSTAGYGEHVDGGTSRFDKNGVIYQAICASCGGPTAAGCTSYPTTAGSWATVDGSANCNQGALKISFDLGPVVVDIDAGPSTNGCAPLTVNFTNNTINGSTFLWDFGDGSPLDTAFNPGSHTYTTPGVHVVRVTSQNTNACFVTDDTVFLTIVVDTNRIKPSFNINVIDSCGPYIINVSNTSIFGSTPGAATFTRFVWDFGDGTTFNGTTPPSHTYPDTGVYTVRLIMIDSTACNSPDTVYKTVTMLNRSVSGSFTIPDSVCVGTIFSPVPTSDYASGYYWSYGNGNTSTIMVPSIYYDNPGTYTVTFIAINPGTCNGADTFTRVITAMKGPLAAFTFTPATPETNIPITYLNQSVDATRYSWAFGDGTGSTEVNPVHQFNKTGIYKTCLTAYNESNCPSIVCKNVETEIVPIVDIPTGFSPNGDGQNDILFVRGAAIKTLDLKIYNRWGQMIFQTKSQSEGWDGTYSGEQQPIDAYGYVLLVTFIDGSKKTLKGNITLLR